MTVIDELPRLRPILGEPKAENDVIQTGFQNLEQVQTSHTRLFISDTEIAAELPLQNAVHAADLLLRAKLPGVVGSPIAAASHPGFTMIPGRKRAFFKSAFRRVAPFAF